MRAVPLMLLALGACPDRTPSCDEVEANIARIAAAEDHATRETTQLTARPNGNYVPMFGAGFAQEIGARCRADKLDVTARRCFIAARSGPALDRCAHEAGL